MEYITCEVEDSALQIGPTNTFVRCTVFPNIGKTLRAHESLFVIAKSTSQIM